MQQLNNTTYQSTDLGDVKPVVVIGGSAVDKFLPNVNNSFHNDEFFFNLNCIDDIVTDETATESGGVISQEIGGSTHEYYIDDSGRLKWDKLFYSCPENMIVRFKVRKSAGIQFYYQPELTPEEIADGCGRPDDIVGSYAVYCDKANNNYKTGKLCHIPRPFVIDTAGNREWCVMLYTEINDTSGWLDITLPAEFMRSADYSVGAVRLDPTFGYATQGGTSFNGVASQIQGTRYAPVSAGTAESISLYVANGSSGNYWKTALYTYSSSSQSFVAESAESNAIVTGWSTLALSTTPDITAIEYVICHRASNGGVVLYYDSDGASSNQYGYGDLSYSSAWPASVSMDFHISVRFSIYCTYSTTGGTGNSYYYQQQQM